MWSYVALAAAAGATLPLQAAFNARLARHIGSPVAAAAISGAVLTVVLAVLLATVLRPADGLRTADLAGAPRWAWLGGFCGAVVLFASTAVVPMLGAARLVAIVMAGQIVCSIILDQYGLFGLPVEPLGPRRAAAAALLIAGTLLLL